MATLTAVMTIQLTTDDPRQIALIVESALSSGLSASATPVGQQTGAFEIVVSATSADANKALTSLERIRTTANALGG